MQLKNILKETKGAAFQREGAEMPRATLTGVSGGRQWGG